MDKGNTRPRIERQLSFSFAKAWEKPSQCIWDREKDAMIDKQCQDHVEGRLDLGLEK